jgi:lysophospholipase L1-like esterase
MKLTVFPTRPSHVDFPARIRASATGLARRLLLVGIAALAATATAPAAVTDISGDLTQVLDTAVGAGNSGRLTANTKTHYGGMTASSNVVLNGFQFTIYNGGGNAQTYNGAFTGPGTLRFQGRSDATWTPDMRLGGTVANNPTGATLEYGRVQLDKTAGVDALAGAITVNTSQAVRIQLLKNHQINDAATITSTAGSGSFYLEMSGFTDTISALTIKTGHKVDTGNGGVLKVTSLTVGGVSQPKGAYTASSGFVLGTGYIDVDNFGPPVYVNPPGVPASPTPADAANNVHPAYLNKLTWAVAAGATSYDVYLWLASDTKPGTPNANVVLTEYTLPAKVLSLSTYKWQVVAKNPIGPTAGPEWTFTTVDRRDISGILPQALDAIVGAGPARLTADATTYYAGTTAAAGVNLNGFQFTIDNGGGNTQTYNGAITGPGTLRIVGKGDAIWTEDMMLGGTLANSPTGVTLVSGRCRLNKTAGVDALAGAITVNTGGTVRIQLLKSNQINDASTITSTAGSGSFYLEMGGFSDTISGLAIKTGHQVQTGSGGVLTVTNLTVNGELKGPGTYTSSSAFVTGTGSVVVPGATTPADAGISTVSAFPSSVKANGIATSTITVTLLASNGSPAVGKSVTLASNRGATDTISAASGPSNVSGAVTFTVTSLTTGTPVFTATDTTDGVTVTQTASVTFTANPPASSGQSTVTASPASVPANGSSTATVTVMLKDSGGTPIAGKTVTLASNRGATDLISAASGVSNASGVVTFTVASLTAGAPVFTATVTTDGVVLTQTATVTFIFAANVVDISNALYPFDPANPNAGVKIDVVVAAEKTARLVGVTQTHWTSGGFSRPVDLNGNTLIIDSGGGNACAAGGPITGNGLVRVNAGGIGMIPIRGSMGNTNTGSTEINSGPVKLEKSSGNALNGTITVNGAMSNYFPNTGNLLWGGNNQVNDASNLILSEAASLNPAGYSDTVGTLAITGNGNIYMGASTSVLRFAASSASTWTSGKQLIIREWNGSPTGGGSEGVFFGASASGLSAGQIANVGFMNPAGFATGLYQAAILATGEVVPTGTAVVPVNTPYDLSPAAAAARSAIYTSTGRADLTAAGSPLTTGTRIVFFGDSITWQNSYISLLNSAIASGAGTQGKTITLINRGINGGGVEQVRDGSPGSGYPSNAPQASFASLLTSDQADIAVVFIGINDVGWRNTTPAAYEQGLRNLAATAAAQGVTLIFATPAANYESPLGAGALDPRIDQFSAIVETVASDTASTFVDLRSAFVAWWQNNNYEIRLNGGYVFLKNFGLLTYDGVHPTSLGNQLIADHLADGILASYTVGSAFDTWIGTGAGGKGLTGADAELDADPDHDGISNGIEFVIGGEPNPAHPGSNSRALLPTGEVVGGNFVFTFTRMDEAAYLNPVVEFDADMQAPWTTAVDPDNADIEITPGTPADTIRVTIPMGANTEMFARLKVTNP